MKIGKSEETLLFEIEIYHLSKAEKMNKQRDEHQNIRCNQEEISISSFEKKRREKCRNKTKQTSEID